MGLLDKAKAAAESAAAKAKEGVEDVQARKDLHGAYLELGKKAFELVEGGTVHAAELDPLAARVRELKAKLEASGVAVEAEEPVSAGPPAMPL